MTSPPTSQLSEASNASQRGGLGRRERVFWMAVGCAAIVGTFVLPMAFPPKTLLRSSSYIAGFNNRVAAVAVAGISFAVTLCLLWSRRTRAVAPEVREEAMPLRWLGASSAAAIAFTAILGALVVRSDVNYTDIGYWQNQILYWSHDHARIYRDFEFAYGPILFYFPAYIERLLAHAGVAPEAGFMVALGLMQVLGLGIVFWLLEQLPLSRRLKGIALAALTVETLTPLLGINYTMFRFAIVYAALLWIPKLAGVGQQALCLALAEVLMLSISPELGVALAAGSMAYALYRGVMAERRWLWLIPVPALAFGVFAALVDKNYFFTMSNFSRGLVNEVVEPMPNVELFLFTAVVLCPLAMAAYIRQRGREAGPIVGVYIAALAMVPSALGRCDVLHVLFGWTGFFLVALLGLRNDQPRWRKLALGSMLFFVAYSSIALFNQYSVLVRKVLSHGSVKEDFDLARLEAVTAGQRIYIPIMAPQFVRRALVENGQLQPSYYSYTMNAETPEGLGRKIEEMHHAEYVLMPVGSQKWITSNIANNWKYRIFRLGYKYPKREPLYDPVAVFNADLREHYVYVGTFGTQDHEMYTLYRQR